MGKTYYITTCNNWNELGKFLKEWTGRDYEIGHVIPCNQTYLVAREEETNKIIGCASYILIGDPFFRRTWALVENVYVTPSRRKSGIAKDIMQTIESIVFSDKLCEFIKLTTRKELGRKLYRSLGYEEGSSFYKTC